MLDNISVKNFISGLSSNSLLHNIHLLDSEKLFLQVFNNCDDYFVKECKSEYFSFNQFEELDFSVTEYGMNGITALEKINTKKSNKIELKPFDFKLYLLEF